MSNLLNQREDLPASPAYADGPAAITTVYPTDTLWTMACKAPIRVEAPVGCDENRGLEVRLNSL